MCIVCQAAPLLAAGGGGAGMIWRSTRVALGRCGPYEDHAAWAAWAAGRPPSDDEIGAQREARPAEPRATGRSAPSAVPSLS